MRIVKTTQKVRMRNAVVDLQRYMGRWHEIKRSDNPFQKQCVNAATATYTLLSDGFVSVHNECKTKNGTSAVQGYAWRTPRSNVLRISFLPLPRFLLRLLPSGVYEIVYVSSSYEYAVVKSKKDWWILARSPQVDKDRLESLMRKVGR